MARFAAITGMHDQLPEEARVWRWVEGKAAEIFARFGFAEIRTPILERLEVFVRSIGESTDIVEKEMYAFESKGGEKLALRPEGTASVVRAYVENGLYSKEPVSKLYYLGPMYRHEKPQKGRFRQFHQIGAEILGSPEPLADCESIVLLWAYLNSLSIADLDLEINSLGCQECRPRYLAELKAYVAPRVSTLCQNCVRRLETNPLRLLDCKEDGCRELTAGAPRATESLCAPCAAHFASVRGTLSDLAVPHVVNPRIVRGLDYYTRTAFEVTAGGLGAQNAVAGGGRYDGLVKEFGGPDLPGVGFAIGLERLVSLLAPSVVPPAEPPVYLAALGAPGRQRGYRLAIELRARGIATEIALGEQGLKGQMRRADKLGSPFVLILGEDELRSSEILLRDMRTKAQEKIPLVAGEIAAKLQGVLTTGAVPAGDLRSGKGS